jgi:putative nucleotidyltransferase with HDIG domain
MTVFQLFPTFSRLFAGTERVEIPTESDHSIHTRRAHSASGRWLDTVEDRGVPDEERLAEVTSILVDLVETVEVDLPLFPRSARDAYQMSLSSQVTPADLYRVLEQDPSLSMRLLRQANQSLVSPVTPCRSIHEAVHRVGISPVRHLLMRATSDRVLVIPEDEGMTEQLQGRAPAVARCARRIARRIGADTNVAFTAGLLHDIGWVVAFDMLRNYEDRFPRWVSANRARDWTLIAEHSHEVLGARLARIWGMPSPVVAAISFHHKPNQAREPEAEMAYIVSVANTLCDHLDLYPQPNRQSPPDWSTAWAIGVDPDRLRRDSKGLRRSLQPEDKGMLAGVTRPVRPKINTERGLGALDDGIEDSR